MSIKLPFGLPSPPDFDAFDLPKTDFETIKALFDRAGIKYEADEGLRSIVVEAKTGPKNLGYIGFVTQMDFDADGNLNTIGCWE